MAQLIVRNIDERVVRALKRQAAENGRSAEAEHRQLLEAALLGGAKRPSFKEYLLAMPAIPTRRSKSKPRRVAV